MNQELLKIQAALDTLENLGFTYEGGQMWKPPLGKAPYYLRNVPKYITANLNQDEGELMAKWLTHDKYYKVLDVSDTTYIITDDKGNVEDFHKSWFYEDGSVDETQDDVEEDSFEDLVYVEPKHNVSSGYFAIDTRKLSKEQHEFLKSNLVFSEEMEDTIQRGNQFYLCMDVSDGKWFYFHFDKSDIKLSFNDLFIHKDNLNAN